MLTSICAVQVALVRLGLAQTFLAVVEAAGEGARVGGGTRADALRTTTLAELEKPRTRLTMMSCPPCACSCRICAPDAAATETCEANDGPGASARADAGVNTPASGISDTSSARPAIRTTRRMWDCGDARAHSATAVPSDALTVTATVGAGRDEHALIVSAAAMPRVF